jgi:phage tail protein X
VSIERTNIFVFVLERVIIMKATYQTIQGDTWDMIAKKVYGAEKHMDYLMENNFPLLDYFIFPAGITVATPELPVDSPDDLPLWRRRGAYEHNQE